MDGNRTHQAPRERRLNGFEGRGNDSQVAQPQALSDAPLPDYTKNDTKDSDLALVIEAWPELSEAVRAGIVALIRASCQR